MAEDGTNFWFGELDKIKVVWIVEDVKTRVLNDLTKHMLQKYAFCIFMATEKFKKEKNIHISDLCKEKPTYLILQKKKS